MSDEQATSPVGEVATDAVARTPRDEPTDDNAAAEQPEVEAEQAPESEEAPVEEFEIDIGGNKHKLKKGTPIEAALDLIQQYEKGLESSLQTKSQEVATNKKAIEEQMKLVGRLQDLKGEHLATYARGVQLSTEINQLMAIDLNKLWQVNPDQARQVSDRLGQLRHTYQEIHSSLAQYGDRLNQAERELLDNRAVEGEQIVRKAIKGFGPQIESEMVAYAMKNGIPEQDAKLWRLNPYAATTTWKAMQYDKIVAQGKAAAKPAVARAPEKPVTPIKGGQGGNTAPPDPEKMSMEDYAAYMNRQERRSR